MSKISDLRIFDSLELTSFASFASSSSSTRYFGFLGKKTSAVVWSLSPLHAGAEFGHAADYSSASSGWLEAESVDFLVRFSAAHFALFPLHQNTCRLVSCLLFG